MKFFGYSLILFFLIALVSFAFADTQTTTLTWVIPSNVSHTLTYGGNCSTTAMYFSEANAGSGATPIDGTATKIPPYDAESGGAACQDGTSKAAITVHNAGNVVLDVNAVITTTLETGVTLKAWLGNSGNCGTGGMGGWEGTCSKTGADDSTVPTTTACVSIGDTTKQVLADVAVSGTAHICLAADFSGMTFGTRTDTLQTSAIQSLG